MNNEQRLEVQKLIDDRIKVVVPLTFMQRKLADTPTDDLQVTNRRYVNLNGTLATRPASVAAITGQRYFATDTNIPMIFDGTTWRNGVGSVVASN